MENVIEMSGIVKKNIKNNLLDISLNVNGGMIYALLGSHNSGKTLLLNILTQNVMKTAGSIRLFGNNNISEESRRVGYIPQDYSGFNDMTVRQNMIYYSKIFGITDNLKIEEISGKLSLKEICKTKVKKLSSGERKRLCLAIILLGNPDLIIWDALFEELDVEEINFFKYYIKKLNNEKKITFLLTGRQYNNFIKFANCYIVMKSGKIIDQFTEKELKNKNQQCIKIRTEEADNAARILHSRNFRFDVVEKDLIVLYEPLLDSSEIIELLVNKGVKLKEVINAGDDMYQYFGEWKREEN